MSLFISDMLSSIFIRSFFDISFIFCLMLVISEIIGDISTFVKSILFKVSFSSDILFLIVIISFSVTFILLDNDVLIFDIFL